MLSAVGQRADLRLHQKTARAPVDERHRGQCPHDHDDLKRLSLVLKAAAAGATLRAQHEPRVGDPSQAAALLTTLILRGPQTAAELRLNAARLIGFADISSVEAFLDELAANEPARVVKLPGTPASVKSLGAFVMRERECEREEVRRAALWTTPCRTRIRNTEGRADAAQRGAGPARAMVEQVATELGITIDKITGSPEYVRNALWVTASPYIHMLSIHPAARTYQGKRDWTAATGYRTQSCVGRYRACAVHREREEAVCARPYYRACASV